MVDEVVFKSIYADWDPQRCHFNKALLLRCTGCRCSQRVLIAERESTTCRSRIGHERCGVFLDLLRVKSTFALGIMDPHQPLPHAKEVKLQCGGLQALSAALPQVDARDVDALLEAAIREFGAMETLSFEPVVRSISAYMVPKRRGGT